jgi:putative IMPACT (imprinted ancient) family translation regulator
VAAPRGRPARSFRTLGAPVEAELRERGSRFRARAVPVVDRAAADAFLRDQATMFRTATHVVPALRLHDGTAWSSDAGEPAGSAGAPLLRVLEGARLTDVAVVVVRWYGGTKLGVGGLARAYGGALAMALDGAPVVSAIPAVRLELVHAYAWSAAVRRILGAHAARQVDHGGGVEAVVRFTLPVEAVAAFTDALRDATRGELAPRTLCPALLRDPVASIDSPP